MNIDKDIAEKHRQRILEAVDHLSDPPQVNSRAAASASQTNRKVEVQRLAEQMGRVNLKVEKTNAMLEKIAEWMGKKVEIRGAGRIDGWEAREARRRRPV